MTNYLYFLRVDPTRLLISLGASVIIQDNNGNTALHWAVDARNVSAISLLLDKNASLDVENAKVLIAKNFSLNFNLIHKRFNISSFQGASCFRLLVQDKPPWLGRRLLQKILDRASQSDKARVNEQTTMGWVKNMRNYKVISMKLLFTIHLDFVACLTSVVSTEIKTLVPYWESVRFISPSWYFVSKFTELLCQSRSDIVDDPLY